MKLRILFATIACLFSITLATSPLEAQKKKERLDPSEKQKVETDPVEALATTQSLIEYGRNTKSPEALITAAGILHRLKPAKPLDVKATSSTEADPKKTTEVGSDALPDFKAEAKELLAEAKKLSANDPHIVALADAVASRATRGASDGPRMFQKPLYAGASDTFTIRFDPGYPVQLAVMGQGNAKLRISIHYRATIDGVISSDIPLGKSEGFVGRIGFMAPVADRVTVYVSVRNLGKVPTTYRLATN
jgi:hypothetical protein